ncbi:YkgJ family cysteine cluster protein [Patescibacteria group bacterium]|nr:YkgJ family cysteine cluster protein [Patescibacteria group bacterium]MBU4453332.1 YkgJ family cysteine cluster protein [Patescibacteria group bacterium]MCG2687750.1 YkgJ family cysteine cluster protein [Candidatus Parcubacteria bacterium]
MEKSGEICKKHGCGNCCNPVRVRKGFKSHLGDEFEKLPFKDLEEVHIPIDEIETTELEAYSCDNYNKESGLCRDYKNRPQICRNSACRALDAQTDEEQQNLIREEQSQDFLVCKK